MPPTPAGTRKACMPASSTAGSSSRPATPARRPGFAERPVSSHRSWSAGAISTGPPAPPPRASTCCSGEAVKPGSASSTQSASVSTRWVPASRSTVPPRGTARPSTSTSAAPAARTVTVI